MKQKEVLPTRHPDVVAQHFGFGMKLTHKCGSKLDDRGDGVYVCGCGLILYRPEIFPIPQLPIPA